MEAHQIGSYLAPYIPILMILVIAAGFAVVNVAIGQLIGPRVHNRAKFLAYECGNEPEGEANVRLPVKFYLVALLFLLFDMETILILAWALAFRDPETIAAIPGYQPYAFCVLLFFLLILVIGFLYEWRKGALKWT
jgi:NADH-quinone oxidoreductase subunit A